MNEPNIPGFSVNQDSGVPEYKNENLKFSNFNDYEVVCRNK